ERNWVLSSWQKGVQERVSSPRSGSSILMTSAPMSPSIIVQKGPARVRVRSTTLIFCKAAVIYLPPLAAGVVVLAYCRSGTGVSSRGVKIKFLRRAGELGKRMAGLEQPPCCARVALLF